MSALSHKTKENLKSAEIKHQVKHHHLLTLEESDINSYNGSQPDDLGDNTFFEWEEET